MAPQLPDPFEHLLRPLFDALPLDRALAELVVTKPVDGKPAEIVAAAVDHPDLRRRPDLGAGLWLYVDDLDKSHTLSQSMKNATGSFWHGIMHRREGDFDNSHYWFRKAGRHPAMARIDLAGGGAGAGTSVARYDPHDLIDKAAEAHRLKRHAPTLVATQRHEWLALFEWCAQR